MFRSLAMNEYRPDLFDQHVLKRAFYRTISQISPNVKLMPVGITFSDLSASSSVFFFLMQLLQRRKKQTCLGLQGFISACLYTCMRTLIAQ